MIEVHLWAGLRAFCGGKDVVEVEARNVGDLYEALARDYPGLAEIIEDGVSVSIDGDLIANDVTARVAPGQEIYLLRKLRGG